MLQQVPEFPSFSRPNRAPFMDLLHCVRPFILQWPSVLFPLTGMVNPTALRLCPVLWSLYPRVAILMIFLRLLK